MEATRETIPCDVVLPAESIKKPLATPYVSYSSTLHSDQTGRSCNVAMTVSPKSSKGRNAENPRHIWALTAPDISIDKAVGSSEATISASIPILQERNGLFPQASCWMGPRELLVLCSGIANAPKSRKGVAEQVQTFELHVQTEDALNSNAIDESLRTTAAIELGASDKIHAMFFIPHQTESVKISTIAGDSTTSKSVESPCLLVALLSLHGNLFFWKIGDASRPAGVTPVVPDGVRLVWAMRESVPDTHDVLSCVQTSQTDFIVVSDNHLVAVHLTAGCEVEAQAVSLEHSPAVSNPITLLPAMPCRHAAVGKPITPEIADFAYVSEPASEQPTQCVVGTVLRGCTIETHTVECDANVIAVFPIQPFSKTKRVVVLTPSELCVYCCRFDGLRLFTMKLNKAFGGVPIPSTSSAWHQLVVFSGPTKASSKKNVPITVDCVTLRDASGQTGCGKTSIVYAMQRKRTLPDTNEGLDTADSEQPPVESTETFRAVTIAYEKLKEALREFPHTRKVCDDAETEVTGSWDTVQKCVGTLEQTLKAFTKSEGHRLWSSDSTSESVHKTLRGIRAVNRFIRYQAVHAKTLQKKLTMLRFPTKASSDVTINAKAQSCVVLDGKYPRRTLESTDYTPWPLRPPHASG